MVRALRCRAGRGTASPRTRARPSGPGPRPAGGALAAAHRPVHRRAAAAPHRGGRGRARPGAGRRARRRPRRCSWAATPGIGKSTLLLQAAARFARNGLKVLYVTGEESAGQVQMRAQRLGLAGSPVRLAAHTSLRDILATLEAEAPDLAIIDSIQTMWLDSVESAPGSVSPGPRLRARADLLRQAAEDGGGDGGPRHQGGRHRRPARGRAPRGHGALLRGRPRPSVPHPARRQEPLRPRRRDRRLRDDRQGADRGQESLRPVPVRAGRARAGIGGLRRASRARGRSCARSRRWWRPPRPAPRAARWWAGTAGGSP